MQQLISIGILVVFIGVVLIIAGSIITALNSKKSKIEWSFVGLIGPFPIGFASSRKMLLIGFAMIVIFLLLLFILKLGR